MMMRMNREVITVTREEEGGGEGRRENVRIWFRQINRKLGECRIREKPGGGRSNERESDYSRKLLR